MNFLSHLLLAGDDEGLRLGALLGDYIRGKQVLQTYPKPIRLGIQLHRHIDGFFDTLPDVQSLRRQFEPPFRRYAGIIIDMALDHQLALHWDTYGEGELDDFDRDIRALLQRHRELAPPGLIRFMHYADRRGLFAAYRDPAEILLSLKGIGTRLSQPNPLHRVDEIWDGMQPAFADSFVLVFPQVQQGVAAWVQAANRGKS